MVAENRNFEVRTCREEINNPAIRYEYREKIMKYSDKPLTGIFEVHEDVPYYGPDLPIEK